MTRAVLDTGPLVATFNPRDALHAWARETGATLRGPLLTCDAVLAEAFHLLRKVPGAPRALREWIARGHVTVPFRFDDERTAVLDLMQSYADLPMDFADACVVRMAQTTGLTVWTTDRRDFSVYRLDRARPVPFLAPPGTA